MRCLSLVTKRLFGLRGGKAAYEAERHEANLLEVQEAARPSIRTPELI